jgi:iron complex transport system substrate-binding protein
MRGTYWLSKIYHKIISLQPAIYIGLVTFLFTFFLNQQANSKTVSDELGHQLILSNQPPQRIISLAPNITEILYAIGADQQLVGVTDYCLYPPQAKSKTKIGGFINPNIEKIVSLKPDIVIMSADSNQQNIYTQLLRLKIKAYVINPDNLDKTFATILHLGEITGHSPKARELVMSLQKRVKTVETSVKGKAHPKVLFLWSEAPLITAGSGTYTHDLIVKAGGTNIAASSPIKYPKYSMEEIIRIQPDIIISAAMGSDTKTANKNSLWQAYKVIPAVKNGRIYSINPDLLARPAPSMISGLEEMARMIHPEAFKKGTR